MSWTLRFPGVVPPKADTAINRDALVRGGIAYGGSVGERLPREPLIGLDIFLPRLGNDIGRQGRRGAVLIPRRAFQPIPDELLVERRLASPGLVLVGRPEAGTVGREHLIDED